MRILTVPNGTIILRTKSQIITKIDDESIKFLADLGKILKRQSDPQGIGLSAVQVGRPVRVFATYLSEETNKGPALLLRQGRALSDTDRPELIFYINPEIITHPNGMTLGEDLADPLKDSQSSHLGGQERTRPFLEGCLSIPKIYGAVLRWPWIEAKAMVISENNLLGTSRYLRPNLQSIGASTFSNFRLGGLAGRVFQHELDHLNGILFTDRVLAQGNKLYRDFGNGPEQIDL